ncbi:hypothetical protein [Couchioplanes azureus]|uniref:hypothetical protein n=1 Tax=Couchioplanes caeruleus TaxID=56438 RepID=UPI0016707546|nr:hypothetical protein [Couchioplanes caeruleus]GGQ88008.1 hypothetical protein GCM10010166_67660 [Couchioplanes caeruleus subsp. azureus]
MLIPRTDHLPARPSWDCLVCERSWPCANAREQLSVQYASFPSGLAIYMASTMYDAVEDLTAQGSPTPADLYERFLAWIA